MPQIEYTGDNEEQGIVQEDSRKVFNLNELAGIGNLKDYLSNLTQKPEDYLSEVVNVKKLAAKIYFDIFEGLLSYCNILPNFRHCRLEISTLDMESLSREQKLKIVESPTGIIYCPGLAHYKAVKFFKKLLSGDKKVCENGDPLRPKWGAYLVGPPGTGKTHLMTAYAIDLKKLLNSKLSDVKSFLEKTINAEASKLLQSGIFSDFEFKTHTNPVTGEIGTEQFEKGKEEIEKLTKSLKKELKKYKYKPTDIVYLTLNNLSEMYFSESESKQRTYKALVESPIVFIDDINPKEKKDANSLGAVIEERYNSGNFATFLTSNLYASDSIGSMYEDKTIGQRIEGRLAEMVYKIDFDKCSNWRLTINKLKIDEIDEDIMRELKEEGLIQEEHEENCP